MRAIVFIVGSSLSVVALTMICVLRSEAGATTAPTTAPVPIGADDAVKLADKLVDKKELGWGKHLQVRKTASNFVVEYITPRDEKRKLGARQVLVSLAGDKAEVDIERR